MAGFAGRWLVLERKGGLCFYDAVVVIHFVIKAQRTARLPLWIPDQFDIGCTIWNWQ